MKAREVRKLIEDSPFAWKVEELMAAATRGIRLRAKRTNMDDLPMGASRMGGLPDLRPDTPWPEIEGRPVEFLAQINFSDAASFLPLPGLPDRGWLVIFFDIKRHCEGADEWRGLFFDADVENLRRVHHQGDQPRGVNMWGESHSSLLVKDGMDFHPCALSMEEWCCLPEEEAFLAADVESENHPMDEYLELFEIFEERIDAPCHLLGGAPIGVQGDPREGTSLRLLLQLDSDDRGPDWMWGDMGRMYFLPTEKALKERDFTQVHASWDCY